MANWQRKWSLSLIGVVILAGAGLWLQRGDLTKQSEGSSSAAAAVPREPSMSLDLPATEFDESWGSRHDQIAEEIAQSSINTARKNSTGTFTPRDAHPKHHGCVKARWSVEFSQLPEDLRVGPFDPQVEYAAWVRFSNGSPGGRKASDADADVRGMAVKLMNVPGAAGGSQDFVLMTSPRFFSQDAEDYLELHRAIEGGGFGLVTYLATHPKNAWIINNARVTGHNPLGFEYFSAVPYKLGRVPMRSKFKPCSQQEPLLQADERNPHFLAAALNRSLGEREACFEVWVQPNLDLKNNPTEDPRRLWDEKVSPFLHAAHLTIEKQTGIMTPEMNAFCENLSFNPWHTLPEIRPLGQINRIRKATYDAVSKFRHQNNARPEIEPVDHSPCQNPATAALCEPVLN